VKYVDHSYDIPITYTIDPYTGENVQSGGGHLVNKTIDITIKNQSFESKVNSTTYQLYYKVQYKGHFEENWKTLKIWGIHPVTHSLLDSCVPQSESQTTIISYHPDFPDSAKIDYRVQAVLAHNGSMRVNDHWMVPEMGDWKTALVSDVSSEWSSTQTVTLPANTPFYEQTIFIIAVTAAIIIAIIGIAVFWSRKKKISRTTPNPQPVNKIEPAYT
jgi:hypothetical protein